MKKILTALTAIILTMAAALPSQAAVNFQDEILKYKVMFKWGFISKVAGYATLDLRTSPALYTATLTARSAPWADRIYSLRDTLSTTMSPKTLLPDTYVYIAHENGTYKKDIVKFSHTGDQFTGIATRDKRAKDGQWTHNETTLHATGPSLDLLSLFFYIRAIDFPRLPTGKTISLNCFSGKKSEVLTLKYNGLQKITVDGQEHLTYYVSFTFTRNGKESSDPIYAWVTADSKRTPLQVEGTLPVGKIRVVLAN